MYEKNDEKILKKHIFQQKSFCDILKSMLDKDLMFLGGRNTSDQLTLKRLPDLKYPLTFTQQLPIWAFLELILPTAWTKSKISQHNHVDQNFGECN